MKKIKSCLLLVALAAAFCLQVGNVHAQGRGSFDPEAMRQRMLDHLREQMDVKSDDEWKIISDRISKVMEARRDVGFGGMGSMFRGGFSRSGRDGGSSTNAAPDSSSGSDRRSRFFGQPSPEEEALKKAIDDKASAADVKAALAKLREARKEKEAKLEKAQADLQKVLTPKQEAVAVLDGLLK